MCGLPDWVSCVFRLFFFFQHTVFLHIYISVALRSFSLSSLALILFSSTAKNVLVLCEFSTYANGPVMWMPKYDDSPQANCQTFALDGFERVIGRK